MRKFSWQRVIGGAATLLLVVAVAPALPLSILRAEFPEYGRLTSKSSLHSPFGNLSKSPLESPLAMLPQKASNPVLILNIPSVTVDDPTESPVLASASPLPEDARTVLAPPSPPPLYDNVYPPSYDDAVEQLEVPPPLVPSAPVPDQPSDDYIMDVLEAQGELYFPEYNEHGEIVLKKAPVPADEKSDTILKKLPFRKRVFKFMRNTLKKVKGKGVDKNAISSDETHSPEVDLRNYDPYPDSCYVRLGMFLDTLAFEAKIDTAGQVTTAANLGFVYASINSDFATLGVGTLPATPWVSHIEEKIYTTKDGNWRGMIVRSGFSIGIFNLEWARIYNTQGVLVKSLKTYGGPILKKCIIKELIGNKLEQVEKKYYRQYHIAIPIVTLHRNEEVTEEVMKMFNIADTLSYNMDGTGTEAEVAFPEEKHVSMTMFGTGAYTVGGDGGLDVVDGGVRQKFGPRAKKFLANSKANTKVFVSNAASKAKPVQRKKVFVLSNAEPTDTGTNTGTDTGTDTGTAGNYRFEPEGLQAVSEES